jgi:hypothetical protein
METGAVHFDSSMWPAMPRPHPGAEASSSGTIPQRRTWMRAGQQAGVARMYVQNWKGSRRHGRNGGASRCRHRQGPTGHFGFLFG